MNKKQEEDLKSNKPAGAGVLYSREHTLFIKFLARGLVDTDRWLLEK